MFFVLAEGRVGQIGEAGKFRLERQLHGAGRSVTLLGDDDVGCAFHLVEQGFPFRVFRIGRIAWLHVLDVIFFTEHEQHHVGVLLDRAGFAKVGKLRTFVFTAFHRTREL